jgi:hypothetical protein
MSPIDAQGDIGIGPTAEQGKGPCVGIYGEYFLSREFESAVREVG